MIVSRMALQFSLQQRQINRSFAICCLVNDKIHKKLFCHDPETCTDPACVQTRTLPSRLFAVTWQILYVSTPLISAACPQSRRRTGQVQVFGGHVSLPLDKRMQCAAASEPAALFNRGNVLGSLTNTRVPLAQRWAIRSPLDSNIFRLFKSKNGGECRATALCPGSSARICVTFEHVLLNLTNNKDQRSQPLGFVLSM